MIGGLELTLAFPGCCIYPGFIGNAAIGATPAGNGGWPVLPFWESAYFTTIFLPWNETRTICHKFNIYTA